MVHDCYFFQVRACNQEGGAFLEKSGYQIKSLLEGKQSKFTAFKINYILIEIVSSIKLHNLE